MPLVKAVKSWEAQLAEGRQAYLDDPTQSLRGKNDVFRQGFYAAQAPGYTYIISYPSVSNVSGAKVTVTFPTTDDAVKIHRAGLRRRGVKNVTITKI